MVWNHPGPRLGRTANVKDSSPSPAQDDAPTPSLSKIQRPPASWDAASSTTTTDSSATTAPATNRVIARAMLLGDLLSATGFRMRPPQPGPEQNAATSVPVRQKCWDECVGGSRNGPGSVPSRSRTSASPPKGLGRLRTHPRANLRAHERFLCEHSLHHQGRA